MKQSKNKNQKGRLLIEAIAFLGMIALITPFMMQRTIEKNLEVEDAIVATQMRNLKTSIGNFMAVHYMAIAAGTEITSPTDGKTLVFTDENTTLDLTIDEVKKFLPPGFQNKNHLGGEYEVIIRKESVTVAGTPTTAISAIVIGGPGGAAVLDNRRGARISSMIGVDGGYTPVDGFGGKADGVAIGGEGLWELDTNDYGGVGAGKIIASTFITVEEAEVAATGGDFLWRTADPADPSKNRMNSNLSLGGNSIKWLDQIISPVVYKEQFKSGAVNPNATSPMEGDVKIGTTALSDDEKYAFNVSGTSLLKDFSLGEFGGTSISELVPKLSIKGTYKTTGTTLSVPPPTCAVGYAPAITVKPNIPSSPRSTNPTVTRNGPINAITGWTVTFPSGGGNANTYCKYIEESFE